MGIDAEVVVRIKGREKWLSEADVERLSNEICSTFTSSSFFITHPIEGLFEKVRPAVQIMLPIRRNDRYFNKDIQGEFVGKVVWFQECEPIVADDDEQFVWIDVYGRYYGKEYERGDWPTLHAIISWLKDRVPFGAVWYGGDSGGICAVEATDTFLKDMDLHFYANGRCS